jgi:hypothetical protein
MDIGPIIQQAQSISVYKEIESARLMEYKEVEDESRIKQIDDVQEYNALMDAELMMNQGSYFDLYV